MDCRRNLSWCVHIILMLVLLHQTANAVSQSTLFRIKHILSDPLNNKFHGHIKKENVKSYRTVKQPDQPEWFNFGVEQQKLERTNQPKFYVADIKHHTMQRNLNEVKHHREQTQSKYPEAVSRSDMEATNPQSVVSRSDIEATNRQSLQELFNRIRFAEQLLLGSYQGEVIFKKESRGERVRMMDRRLEWRDIELINDTVVQCSVDLTDHSGICNVNLTQTELNGLIDNLITNTLPGLEQQIELMIQDFKVNLPEENKDFDQTIHETLDLNDDSSHIQEAHTLAVIYSDLLYVACHIEKARKDEFELTGIPTNIPQYEQAFLCGMRIWMNSVGVAIDDMILIHNSTRLSAGDLQVHVRRQWDRAILFSLRKYLERVDADFKLLKILRDTTIY